MIKFTSIIFISLLTGACSTQPTVRYKTPTIHGSLQVNGSATSNTSIFLSLDASDSECRRFVQQIQTNEQGQFTLRAEKEPMDYAPLVQHYLDEWTICAEVQGVRRLLYSNNRYGMDTGAKSITLTCHIPSQSKNESPCRQALYD